MQFIALINAFCSYNACLFFYCGLDLRIVIAYTNAFCFHALYLGHWNIACLHQLLGCISAYNQLFFPNFMFTMFLFMKALSALW